MTMAKYTIFNMLFTPKLPTIRGMWFVLYRDKPKEDFRMIYIARSREEAREFIRWCKNNSFDGKNPMLQFFRETNSLYDNLKETLKRVVLDGNSEIPNNHKCDHPYHSVVGGNGRPERCLACGKVLSI